MAWKVPQFQPFMGAEEADAVLACVKSGWVTEGPRSLEFVERIKKLAGVGYGVLAPNGTLALYLALKACGVGDGWTVIVPDTTFIATATAVVMAGARPRFVDVDEHGQLDWELAKKAYTDERCLYLPVHLYGFAGPVHEAPAIEDACQALGVTFNGKPCGSLGKASAFSFFADKTITTGEGGFVGTNDPWIYDRLKYIRNQGRVDRGSFVHPRIGQNFRMTDLQCAMGIAQLDKFNVIVERKQTIFQMYKSRLEGVVEFLEPPRESSHIPFRTVVLLKGSAADVSTQLRDKGIEPRSAFYPLHRQPCFQSMNLGDSLFPRANYLWDHALCLPSFPGMDLWQLELVCDAIKEIVKK